MRAHDAPIYLICASQVTNAEVPLAALNGGSGAAETNHPVTVCDRVAPSPGGPGGLPGGSSSPARRPVYAPAGSGWRRCPLVRWPTGWRCRLARLMNGQLIGATPLVAQRKQRRARPGTSLLDDLAAQRALGRSHVVGADHGVEQLVGDAHRQQQV